MMRPSYHVPKQEMWYGPRKENIPVVPGYCKGCEDHHKCKKICQKIEKMVNTRGIGEKHYHDRIVLFSPNYQELNFASLPEELRQADDFSSEECIQLNTDAIEKSYSRVFAERFFNRKSFKDIADILGVTPSTVAEYFYRACERVETMMEALDGRNKALMVVGHTNFKKFTDDEKAFLLSHVFGFKVEDVAEMVGGPGCSQWKKRIKKMSDKYRAAFDQVDQVAA